MTTDRVITTTALEADMTLVQQDTTLETGTTPETDLTLETGTTPETDLTLEIDITLQADMTPETVTTDQTGDHLIDTDLVPPIQKGTTIIPDRPTKNTDMTVESGTIMSPEIDTDRTPEAETGLMTQTGPGILLQVLENAMNAKARIT